MVHFIYSFLNISRFSKALERVSRSSVHTELSFKYFYRLCTTLLLNSTTYSNDTDWWAVRTCRHTEGVGNQIPKSFNQKVASQWLSHGAFLFLYKIFKKLQTGNSAPVGEKRLCSLYTRNTVLVFRYFWLVFINFKTRQPEWRFLLNPFCLWPPWTVFFLIHHLV